MRRAFAFTAVVLGTMAAAPDARAAPAPVGSVQVVDHPWDGGDTIDVAWSPSPDSARVKGYVVERAPVTVDVMLEPRGRTKAQVVSYAVAVGDTVTAGQTIAEFDIGFGPMPVAAPVAGTIVGLEAKLGHGVLSAEPAILIERSQPPGDSDFVAVAKVVAGESVISPVAAALPLGLLPGGSAPHFAQALGDPFYLIADPKLTRNHLYAYRVVAIDETGARSSATAATTHGKPRRQKFDATRFWFLVTLAMFCGAVAYYIRRARGGEKISVRKIAGLAAVDEAVGRATEMGRPCLFVAGIQDMNDIQTIAGINVLARVAKTAAEYDAKIEVPTSRSLVMTAARETVHNAYLAAGRPDAYNEDAIYYVTDEQFGFVAYAQGMMVREKPAACFYMGAFFAESLILAETGNSIGAIQVAGTAMPAQLPFFVAACDYTLIGEEFFAASAYLSGSPEELGSLKGQDVGKFLVAAGILGGVASATLAAMTGSAFFQALTEFLRTKVMS